MLRGCPAHHELDIGLTNRPIRQLRWTELARETEKIVESINAREIDEATPKHEKSKRIRQKRNEEKEEDMFLQQQMADTA